MLKKYACLKYLSAIIMLLVGLSQPAIFSRYLTLDEFTLLTVLYGIANYLIFFDFGIGKPAYSGIRKKFVQNDESWKRDVSNLLIFYFTSSTIVVVIFAFISFHYYSIYKTSFSFFSIILFVFLVAGNILLNNIENIYNSIGQFMEFQKYDLSRRIINISILALIPLDPTLLYPFLLGTSVLFILLLFSIAILFKNMKIQRTSLKSFIDFFKLTFLDARLFFIFTICEVVIYNFGFVLFPGHMGNKIVITYGIWIKVFTGINIFSGIIINIFIHHITRYIHSGKYNEAQRIFNKALIMSISIATGLLIFFTSFREYIFNFWLSDSIKVLSFPLIALYIWCLGNCVQSCAGIFLISKGGEYQFLCIYSILSCITIFSSVLFLISRQENLEVILEVSGVLYLFAAMIYLRRSFSFLRKRV